MKPVTVTSKKGMVTIRQLAPGDTRALLTFANTLIAEDTFLMLSGKKLTYEEEKKYVADSLIRMRENKKFRIVATLGDIIIASAELRRGERRKLHMGEIGMEILEPYRGKGIGSKFMEILISEAKRMGLRLLMLRSFENNTGAISFYKKFGFIPCGVLPDAFRFRGSYIGETTFYRFVDIIGP
jgi:RimJ/RimL family protein N-acetyltransferase